VVWDEAPEIVREEELETVAYDDSGVMEEGEPEMLETEDRPVPEGEPVSEEESLPGDDSILERESHPESEAPPTRPGRQPEWLFSLLKREGEDEEDEDA